MLGFELILRTMGASKTRYAREPQHCRWLSAEMQVWASVASCTTPTVCTKNLQAKQLSEQMKSGPHSSWNKKIMLCLIFLGHQLDHFFADSSEVLTSFARPDLSAAVLLCRQYFQSIGPLGRCFLYIDLSVRQFVCVCSLLRYRLNVFLPPLPKFGCPIFLEIRNPWGKVIKRGGLTFEHFCLKVV